MDRSAARDDADSATSRPGRYRGDGRERRRKCNAATGIADEIAERTDGVPLFVEELTRAVIESGAEAPAALSLVPHPTLAVPATLHASLMARLDRLGPAAKDVAQTGAAIGREFGYELLASTTDQPGLQLREAL